MSEINQGDIRYIHDEAIHNLTSPREIVPFVMDLMKPRSIIDVGCGLATFAAVFLEKGVQDVLAIDGTWVEKKSLKIDAGYFQEVNLETFVDLQRRFDLAVCLEVAEHLRAEAAPNLVKSLCGFSDIILFSAAIPNQGGQNHVNEQPFSYWQGMFNEYGYGFYDIFRRRFWDDAKIDWWYRQNMFLVATDSAADRLGISDQKIAGNIQLYVHPDLFYQVFRSKTQTEEFIAALRTPTGFCRMVYRKLKNGLSA